jgi:hypothetical protein
MTTDQMIDAVVREVTAAVPTSPLRARVIDALDGRPPAERWSRAVPSALAAIAVVSAGVAAAWQAQLRVAAPARIERAVTAPARTPAAGWASPTLRHTAEAASAPTRRSMSATGALSAEEPGWQSRAVAPLVPPAPLDSGQPAPAVSPLPDVEALAIEALELKALDSIDPVSTGGA